MFGWLIALVTFPGVILHEWSHKFFCDRTGIPVYKTCYFRLGNPSGFVLHGPVDSYGKTFVISTAPFLTNTVISVILFAIAIILPHNWVSYVLMWLGLSTALHAFPSNEDADSLWNYSKLNWRRSPLAFLTFPISGLIKLAALARAIWFDLLYAVAILIVVALIVKGGNIF